MDKYEYKLKTEQMLELMNDGAYNKAAEIADSIDWKRVRNTTMLSTVSEIYEKNRDYQKSYDVLAIAYSRAEGSRKIVSRLCTLALKTRNVDEAIDYYDDFIELAPKDPNQYILKYQILRAQRAPIEQQIHALEEFKKAEYIEEWAYELAKLYQEAGMTAECLEECDDLILWFSEGKYVYQAMELKMQYKPLTPSQQEKYDRRYEKPTTETEELPDLTQYQKKEEPSDEEVEEELEDKLNESEEQMQETSKKKIGNTMKLDEALKSLLNIKLKGEAGEETSEEAEVEEEEDLTELESEIEEIESVADLGFAEKVAEEKKKETIVVDPDLEELRPDPELDEEVIEEDAESEEIAEGDVSESVFEETEEDGDQIAGQMNLMDFLEGWGEPESSAEDSAEDDETIEDVTAAEEFVEEESTEDIDALEYEEAEEFEEPEYEEAEEFEEPEYEETEEFEEPEYEEAEEFEEPEYEEAEDFLEEEYEESETGVGGEQPEFVEDAEEDWTSEADDTFPEKEGVMEDKNKGTTPILSPDIQRLIDEIEGNIPPQEEKPAAKADYYEEDDEPHENMGALADELRMEDESDEFEDYDDLLDEDEYEDDTFVWGKEDAVDADEAEPFGLYEEDAYGDELSEDFEEVYDDESAEDFEEVYDDESAEDSEEVYDDELAEDFEEVYDNELSEDFEEVYDDELAEGFEEVYDDELAEDFEEDYEDDLYEDDLQSVTESFEEEFRPQKHFDEVDDREIPDDDDEIDLLSATTPLSRKETAKLIATGKTAPLPMDEISDALSISNTGFVVHGRYDLKAQSGIGTRAGLTDEQKKLFSYFVPVRGMSEQLVDVLEQDKNCTNRKGTSCTGNLLIIGNKGNGKTVLAVDVVKAIQKQREIRQGKVAIVTGDSLNKKKISDIFAKLYGGALIIEKAGKMNEKTVARLNKAMESDTGELLIVLEDQRKPLDRLLSSNREFRRKFTSRLEVPVFINDELVTFGQTYAQENGYRIDEMSILALYSRIDSLQREDHAVTVAEVKEIMDEAMAHSQKVSAKKLVKRVFGRNTDDSDRIILTEKDFNI